MKRELKSNYATVDESKSILQVYENEPSTHWSEFSLKNVTIKFNEDATIEVTGERIQWSLTTERLFLEDMKNKPRQEYVRMGYKTIIDFFKGIKKPYIKYGWYKLEKTSPYHCLMSKWYVVL